MGRIPEDIISEVLARTDTLQVIGEYVRLKRTGSTYKGLCPFHGEKTPSFNVNPDRGFFKCFGCGEGGSLLTFLMKIEGWSFPESVRHLAGRVGVQVPETSEEDKHETLRKERERRTYLRIMAQANDWFQHLLWKGPDASGRQYLEGRGISEASARAFGLGLSPVGWSGTLDHLKTQGVSAEMCAWAGLALKGTRGHYDRFRGRLMFPVLDIWGAVVAFGGRIIHEDQKDSGAKYINSPETPFYRKGRELYGLGVTKTAIRKQGEALLVEGNFDVIALHSQGIEHAVCPMGTAVTERQVKLLKRFTHKVTVAFDGDSAGRSATLKALPQLLEQSLDARVLALPLGEDPDTFVRAKGPEALSQAVEEAVPIVTFAIDQIVTLDLIHAPIEERVVALKQAAEVLQHVHDDISRRHYAKEVARRLEISPEHIDRYIKRPEQLRDQRRAYQVAGALPSSSSRRQKITSASSSSRDAPRAAPDVAIDDSGSAPFWGEGEIRAEPRPLPVAEVSLFQVLSDLPDKLMEFVEQGCCRFLTDERLVALLERVHARASLSQQPPEFAVAAEGISKELGDEDFFQQISATLCADKPYDEVTIEQSYTDSVLWLQEQHLNKLLGEPEVLFQQPVRALAEVTEQEQQEGAGIGDEGAGVEEDPGLQDAIRLQELLQIRRELDSQFQRQQAKMTDT